MYFMFVERKELVTKIKSMIINNDFLNTKDESSGKLLDPELSTSADWSIGNLDETLLKIEQMRSARLIKENEKLKKAVKHLVEKNSDLQENLLGAHRSLWKELRARGRGS